MDTYWWMVWSAVFTLLLIAFWLEAGNSDDC